MITKKQAQRFLDDIEYGFAIHNLMVAHSPKYDDTDCSPLYNRLLEIDDLERKVTAMEQGNMTRDDSIIKRYRDAMNSMVRECEEILGQ